MKRLFIMTHNMAGGGCEHVIAQLANRFADEGTKVTVLTEYAHESFFKLDPAICTVALSDKPKMSMAMIPQVYGKLRSLVMAERPDAVLAMPEKVNVWTVLFLIGSGVPVIVSERNDPRRHPENKLKRLLRRLVYPFAAGFVFQTEQQRAFFPKQIQKRGIVLDNPLDVDALPDADDLIREKTVVTAARLEPQKNLSMLISAFAGFTKRFPEYKLVIYGEGSERKMLEEKVHALAMSTQVSLPGAVENVPERIRSAGMFVLSSDFEGMPNALIEAMAMGRPCISTACPCGGPEALIENGQNGLLVPVGSESALEEAMVNLAENAAFAEKLGASALKIRERMNISVVAKLWREYIDAVIQRKKVC